MTNVTSTEYVQNLLDKASGLDQAQGDPRLKAILRDVLQATCELVEKHNITEGEFWSAVSFMGNAAPEFGLIVPGIGIEHFFDLVLDARDKEVGADGGTPRTIEGPLYVEGAPLSDNEAVMSNQEENGERLYIRGRVLNLDGNPLSGAIVDVWHANLSGFYSHFDPTNSQEPFNNRRKIKVGADGSYLVKTVMPKGYAVPPNGSTEQLLDKLGRHGNRPAHVHFFADVDGYRHLTTQINIADDPFVMDDFAYGTREGLVPDIKRENGEATIEFDLVLVAKEKSAIADRSSRPRLTV
ncbi:dioxygenase [Hirschia litorea]|uniref:Dioxygenase n=1 Tax=Hirschia litorea TaxID=1199156 RepID=A0ABW2IK14_9PROT